MAKRSLYLLEQLRPVRLGRQLSQAALAGKLQISQKMISELETGRRNPRLSTIQDVARALDLELMLVPRHLIPLVENLQRQDPAERPMYVLDDGDNPREENEEDQPERHSDPVLPRGRTKARR